MSEWICKRCGHGSFCKGNLLKHLKRKKECQILLSDITREHCIQELTQKHYNEKTYDCIHCNKKFNNSSNRQRHYKVCPKAAKPESSKNGNNIYMNAFTAMSMIAAGSIPQIPPQIPPQVLHIHQNRPTEGFVYCLANTCMPGIVKIGLSMNVKRRMLDLSGATSAPFHCCYAKKVANMRQSEKWLHNQLERFRVPSKNEFFQIDSFYVKALMDTLDGEYYDIDNAYIIKSHKNNETLETETTDGNVSCTQAQPCN